MQSRVSVCNSCENVRFLCGRFYSWVKMSSSHVALFYCHIWNLSNNMWKCGIHVWQSNFHLICCVFFPHKEMLIYIWKKSQSLWTYYSFIHTHPHMNKANTLSINIFSSHVSLFFFTCFNFCLDNRKFGIFTYVRAKYHVVDFSQHSQYLLKHKRHWRNCLLWSHGWSSSTGF